MATRFSEMNMQSMLLYRMGWNVEDPKCPFTKWVPVHLPSKDKVVLFFVHNDVPQMLEDDRALYPSDALVTKLRMVEGG